jgi:outer membrane protein OmpA-like peptidoglycan-associated protein
MDIFSSNDLTTVTCLPAPINSTADDLSIFFTEDNKGFISSNRVGSGTKSDDIYQFYIPKLKTKAPDVVSSNSALLAELDALLQKLEKENDPNAVLIKKAMLRLEEQDKQMQQLALDYNNSSVRMMQYIDTANALSFEEKVKLYEQVIADDYLILNDTQEIAVQQMNQDPVTSPESTNSGVPKDVKQQTPVSSLSTASGNGVSETGSSVFSEASKYNKQSFSDAAFQKLSGKPLETTDSTARAMVDAFVGEKFQLTDAKQKLSKEIAFIDQTLTPFVAQNNNIDLKLIAEHFQLSLDELNALMASSFPITFYFDFDKSVIKKEEEEKLNYLLNLVKTFEGSIRIEGHTDSKGKDAYNLKLAAKRSQKVYSYLVNFGIPKDSITRVNFGESMPVADNQTNEGRALNRRVVVILNKRK